MIKLENMTPEVYYKQSRDFQFIGRLYDIVLNSTKTNTEIINNLSLNNNLDSNLVDLLVTTLGFKTKHNYNLKQLTALGSAFSLMLREKGTKQAIQTAIGLVLNAEGIIDNVEDVDNYIFIDAENYNIEISVPNTLTSFSLLIDLLEYILPAGMSYKIIKGMNKKELAWTELGLEDYVEIYKEQKPNDMRLIKADTIINDKNTIEDELTDKDTKSLRLKNKSFFYINSSMIKASAENVEGE